MSRVFPLENLKWYVDNYVYKTLHCYLYSRCNNESVTGGEEEGAKKGAANKGTKA